MQKRTVVAIPGDGIGPEVFEATKAVLEAAGANIEWVYRDAGLNALEKHNEVMPQETIDSILEHHIAIKGPCTTPVGKGFSSVNVQLRKNLDLYAAVRPVRSLDGVPTRYENVDIVIIRENTEGLYSGIENEITPGVVTSLKVATEKGCSRINEWAFKYAKERGRKKVTAFHKANIMKLTDGLFISEATKAHQNGNTEIEHDQIIIDAACMKMVQDPTQFDVLVLENLYGDVISDLCAGLVGGLGVVPGANYGKENAIFEAVHGSAPDIAGQNLANPLALIMSSVMMLNFMGGDALPAAEKIKAAYNKALTSGQKTKDLGGTLGTKEFTEAIISHMN